jgi:hypothetical protein
VERVEPPSCIRLGCKVKAVPERFEGLHKELKAS